MDFPSASQVLLLVLFLAVWSWMMGSFLYHTARVRPNALRRWAEGLGCEILRKDSIGWERFFMGMPFTPRALAARLPPFEVPLSNAQEVYRLTLRDRDGRDYRCWAKVGAYWSFPLTTASCPIEIRWDGPEPPSKKPAGTAHPLRDREIDG